MLLGNGPLPLLELQEARSVRQPLHLPTGTVQAQRDDLLHPTISGNKGRKLIGWLSHARAIGARSLLTFGGAHSNHLVATAAAAQALDWPLGAVIRGDEPMDNPRLSYLRQCGARLYGVPRSLYREKAAAAAQALRDLALPEPCLIIPEGGAGPLAFLGFQHLVKAWKADHYSPTHLIHASATGSTAVGLAAALHAAGLPTQVHSVQVLRNAQEQHSFAQNHASTAVRSRIHWHTVFHHGGYARITAELADFTESIAKSNAIPLEPIYTGKALFALNALLPSLDGEVCFLHTGGIFPYLLE